MSKAELRRLGGLSGVLTMLESTKPSVQESAILVITNCTQDDDQFCLQLMQVPPEKLRLILSFLQSSNELIQSNVARAVANASSVDPEVCKEYSISDALMFAGIMPNLLKLLGSGRVPLMRSIAVTLDNILQDLPEATSTMFEMGGPEPVITALACKDSIVQEHCASVLSTTATANPLFVPYICKDVGLHMRAVVDVLASSVINDSRPVESFVEVDPVEDALLNMFVTITATSGLAVVTMHELGVLPRFVRLLLAPNSQLQLFAVTIFANCVSAYAVSSGGEDDPIADLQARLSSVRLYFFKSEAWLTLTWLLDHANRKIQSEARRFMEGLRTFGGVVADKFDDHEPSIRTRDSAWSQSEVDTFVQCAAEAGIIPVLQGLTGSVNEATVHYCDKLLRWTKDQCKGPCLSKMFASVAGNEDNNARLKAAVALFYMSFDAKWIRDPFLNKSGLPVILPLLKLPGPTRYVGLEFLKAVEPILQPMEDEEEEDVIQVKWGPGDPLIRYKNLAEPPEPEDFTMEDVNMKGDSDLLLRVGPTAEELVSIRLHKDIMAAHSAVVAGMLSNQHEIEIPGVHAGFVERVMKAIYGGDLMYIWDDAKAIVDEKIQEFDAIQAAAAEAKAAKAAAKAKTTPKAGSKPQLPRSTTAASLSKDVASASSSDKRPVWDDVGYTIKVLLFSNRMQLLRIQKIAAARLEDQLAADNVLRVFKAGLAAADIALCAACMGVVIEQLPVNKLEPPPPPPEDKEDKRRPLGGSRTPTARGNAGTPDRKPPVTVGGAAGKDSPAARSVALSGKIGAKPPAPTDAGAVSSSSPSLDEPELPPVDPEKLAAARALERDIKELIDVLKTFITRVMASSSADE